MSDAIRHVLTLYRVIYSILLTEHLTSKNYDENFRKNNSTKLQGSDFPTFLENKLLIFAPFE